jgi:hypothetical protein
MPKYNQPYSDFKANVLRKGRSKKNAGRRKLKVPRPLRKAIRQVMEAREVTGRHIRVENQGRMSSLFVDKQTYYDPRNLNLGEVDSFVGIASVPTWDFTPEYFLDSVCKLWCNKPSNTLSLTDLGVSASSAFYENWPTLKVNVVNSTVSYHIRNCGYADITLEIYNCAPKHASAYSLPYSQNSGSNAGIINSHTYDNSLLQVDFIEGINGTNIPSWTKSTSGDNNSIVIGPPAIEWDNCYKNSRDMNEDIPNANTEPAHYGSKPTHHASFKKMFSTTYTKILLTPGQEYIHHVQGPKNFLMDFKKFFKAAPPTGASNTQLHIFMNLQKFCRSPIFVLSTDVRGERNTSIGPKVARWIGGPLSVIRTTDLTLKIPEEIGGVQPAAAIIAGDINKPLQLTLRRPAFLKERFPLTPTSHTSGHTAIETSLSGVTIQTGE